MAVQYVSLGDVCSKGSSGIAQKDLENNSGCYPIYGAGGLIKYVNFYQQEREYIAVVKDGAGIGRTMRLPAKSSVIGTMQYIIPNEKVDISYLYYVITFMNLSKYFSGATIPHIYFKDYQKERFPLPSMDRQREVASVLKTIDGLICYRKQQLSKLSELVQSRFIEMFGDMPETEYVTIENICSTITDGTHQPPKFVSDGIPFLFVSNIITNQISYNTEKFISEETYSALIKRTPIEVGDILLSTVGSYGHPAIVQSTKKFCFQRHIAYLKPKKKMINSEYFHSAILSGDVRRQIDEHVKGVAQKTLNLSDIRKIRLPLPSLDRQNQFATFVQVTHKSKLAVQKSLEELELLKKSLMQEYFG